MALKPGSIDAFLNRHSTAPDFKTMPIDRIQRIVEARTGRAIQKTKGPELWDHQFRALATALFYGRSLSFLGMRTGKTRVMLEWASHMRITSQWKGTGLIIVPSPTVLGVWKLQIPEYSNLAARIVRSGSNDEFLTALDESPDLIVISWPALQQLFSVRKLIPKLGQEPRIKLVPDFDAMEYASKCFTLTAIDEIHYCKNPQSLHFKMGVALSANHEWKLGLTGTPYGRDPYDAWAQAFIADEGKALSNSFHFFKMAFAKRKPDGKYPKGYTGYPELKFDKKLLPVLGQKLATLSISYELGEIRKLNIQYKVTKLNMTNEQAGIYEELISDHIDRVMSKEALTNIYTRLRQISSGHEVYTDDWGDKVLATLPINTKLTWLRGQIKCKRFTRSTIIFYSYSATGAMIARELKQARISFEWLHGGVTKGRDEMIARFQAGQSTIFLANSKSGSEAIDLSAADDMVFFEAPPSSTLRTQGEKRPMAASRGDRLLTIEDIVASPIETHALEMLAEGHSNLMKGIHSSHDLLGKFSLKRKKSS